MRRRLFAQMVAACAAGASLRRLQAATLPRPAGSFEFVLPDGTKQNLTDYLGKVVCIEFLFTTCPHCQEASRLLSRLHKEYGPRGFQPLGVAFNEGAMMLVPEFVRNFGVTYPVGVASRERVLSFLQYPPMARIMVPQVAFLDRKGNVRVQSSNGNDEHLHSEANLRKTIEELLKENPPASARPATKAQPRASAKK
ncbi:MAG: TlpA family protein disulfide reductase [Bryobacteraceae bacterium]|nr:TlpA family protein disulfide reductase [Bryobacteraceae bacterium]MDW8380152.1 TlpA disulfide reductase family protein [Bryobacterales bacterium]